MRAKSRLPPLIIAGALFALTWSVFGRTIGFPFMNYDDPAYIFEHREVTGGLTSAGIAWSFTHEHGGNWHPLTSMSHMLDCQLFGLRAGGPHFVNVLLHSISAAFLFLVLRGVTGRLWPSAFVAAVFAIHPLRVESVAWIAERKDVLSGLLFVLTLFAYVRYTRARSLGRYAVMVALYAFGLMAKPMLVTMPIVLLLLDYWPLGRLHTRGAFWNCIVEKVPLFALAAASSTATIITQQAALSSFTHLPLADRLGNALMSYVVYIREMFWPTNLAVIYPLRPNQFSFWQITAAAGFLAAITVATWLSRKSRPYLFVGWLWYVSILLPVIGIVQVGLQAHADRYTYLPQIGLYIAIAWSVSEFAGRIYYPKAIVAFASVFALVALTSATWAQLSYWREPLALWEHTIAVTSDNDVAHSYLADLLLRNGRIPDAISHAQEAIRLNPVNADAQNNLGLALLQAGDEQDAVIHLEQGLKIDSENANARINLAWILATSSDARLRDGARAVTLAETVVRGRGRDNSTVLRTLAAAYAEAGRFSEAMETAERALQIAKANGESGLATDLQAAIENYRSERTLRSK